MKKFWVYYLTIALFVLIACNKEAGNDIQKNVFHSNPNGQIKIRWLAQWFGEGKKETLIREIAREFSFLNQDCDVVIEFPYQMTKTDPTRSTFLLTTDSIIKMIASNTWPYDLMLCDAYLYQRIGDSIKDRNWGSIYLENFIHEPWFIDAHKDGLFKTGLYTDVFGGIAPGAYIEGVWDLLYVSSETENKLGIKVKAHDMNMDDFKEYAKLVYTYNQNHSDKITFFSLQRNGIDFMFNHLVMSTLQKEFAANNEEAFVALAKTYEKIEALVPYSPLEQNVTFANERELRQDKILFSYNPSWISLLWQASNPEGEKKMIPCELPSVTDTKAYAYPGRYNAVFVIPKNAKNKDLAIKLMKFISSQETAEKWLKYSKCPTGLKNKISYNEFGSDEFNEFARHINQKYQDRLDEVSLPKTLFNTDKLINFNARQVMLGQMTAFDALNSVKLQLK
jgi:ABC-type glycerol-3-phosphate transport system substrate-binding protein